MAVFMWMDGVPGRPGWDGWFQVDSFHFGGQPSPGGSAGVRPSEANTASVLKQNDASSSAIMLRSIRGDIGAASLWLSGENDVPLYQIDMTDAIVTAYVGSRSGAEHFQLSFAKATWTRATSP